MDRSSRSRVSLGGPEAGAGFGGKGPAVSVSPECRALFWSVLSVSGARTRPLPAGKESGLGEILLYLVGRGEL